MFRETVLPNFIKRVEGMRQPITKTLRMMLAEYEQPLCNLACPICVYNQLRKEQGKRKQQWNI